MMRKLSCISEKKNIATKMMDTNLELYIFT